VRGVQPGKRLVLEKQKHSVSGVFGYNRSMVENKETVYLVDGTSYIHRAYHAIRGLSNSKGFPTNAVLGFTKMVLKLLTDKAPKYLAMAFDAKGPTFRHEIYDAYKANRPPMPEEMARQIPVIKEIVTHLNLKMIEKEGYEADDIIGTLARVGEERGLEVVIVTGDKDFRQLISPRISMWDPMKDTVTDYGTLKEASGVDPERFIDVMALAGDSSDNIPGVPGVGEKTAVELIREFGSFEGVYDHVEEIKRKKLQQNLHRFRDQALLSRKLVTIDLWVPLDEDLTQMEVGEPQGDKLAEIFRALEFRGLWEQFATRREMPREYLLCLTKDDLSSVIQEIRSEGVVSIDTETTSENPFRARLVGISFSCQEGRARYVPLGHNYLGAPPQIEPSEALTMLEDILEDGGIRKIGQNIKYDAEVLKLHGAALKGLFFDTMIASYVINPGLRQYNLDYLAQHYLNHKMIAFHDVVGKGKKASNFSEVDVERACEYSCEDADMTLRLWGILDKKLEEDGSEALFYDLEMKLLPVLMDMEMAGIKIDTAFFQDMSVRFAQEMEDIEREIFEEAGMEFNLNSPQQLGYVLFEKLQLPVQKKTIKTKRYSTDVKVLEKLARFPHKLPRLVLGYRTLSKLKSTYLDALVKMVDPSTGRLHTSFNQTVAATGRLSSSEPNLQNIPIRGKKGREIRKGFIAEKGQKLISADYSQIELRVFAHYSGDDAFIEAFNREEDIHARTASEVLGGGGVKVTADLRRIAKAINFGIIYGMGARKLGDELGIDQGTAKKYIEAYYEKYKGVASYRETMIEKARKDGYVTTLFNRRRYLPDIQHGNRIIRGEAERMAVNTPIQGTAADLIKQAMVNIDARLRREGFKFKMILQVHDELLFEVPQEEVEAAIAVIREEMEGVHPLKVPLKVDIGEGENWAEAH